MGDGPLAKGIFESVATALGCPQVHLASGKTVWEVFEASLNAAIRDIETHPQGRLFRRLIEYGPALPDAPALSVSDGQAILSDPECGSCVNFIHSHMVNRFKGELAELLALEPCIALAQKLQQEGRLPRETAVYWGDSIQERRRTGKQRGRPRGPAGPYAKGADGLFIERTVMSRGAQDTKGLRQSKGRRGELLRVHGIVEVKSMPFARGRILRQINHHISRLAGGVQLKGSEWPAGAVQVDPGRVVRVMVRPSEWKLSREWRWEKGRRGEKRMVFPQPQEPPVRTAAEELDPGI